MTLIERIEQDVKEAMKAKNESKLSALRLVRSALKNKQIDLGHPLTDDEAQSVVKTLVKQYKDALNDFVSAGRTDLADKQKEEIAMLEIYLPAQMGDAEIEAIVKKVIETTNATMADMGRVMGAAMKEVAGRADGNKVKEVVQNLLK
jgi:hypothetical protein